MTSALAARKAALAAQALQAAAPAPKAPSPAARTLTPTLSEDDIPGPSKRRKISATKKKTARYFAPRSDSESESGSNDDIAIAREVRKRNRKFSPSAPASEADDGMDDSSDDAEEASSIGEEVDEGRAVWTAPVPVARTGNVKTTSVGSKFKPVAGVNVTLVTEEELSQSGIAGEGAGVVISLGKQESVMLAGIYTILSLQNPLNILSTTLYPSSRPIPVFGPSSHPNPVINPSTSRRRATPSGYLRRLPLPTTFNVGENRTIFLIREHECGFQGLRNGVVPGFSNIWGEHRGLMNLKGIHLISGNSSAIHHPHVQPESWSEPLKSLAPNSIDEDEDEDEDEDQTAPIILVKGPKRSGKSTFARATLNNLLNRYEKVAWLECDLGQGEFSPGGVVGIWVIDQPILGPPFTHPRVAERAHFLGSFTPQTCPDEYIAAIQHLINHYTYEIAHPLLSPSSAKITSVIPLVINTQGWVKGLGEELLRSIESCTSPSHIMSFELDEPAITNGNGNGNGWTSSPPPEFPSNYTHLARPPVLHTIQSAPITPLLARHTPSDLRTLSMIAYFHAHLETQTWNFNIPLLAIPPYQVELSISQSSPLRRVYISGEGSESIISEDLGLALNGNIVALIHEVDQDPNIESLYDPSSPIPLDETTNLGLALIRGLKATEEGYTLHLITPLGEEILGKANAIIRNGAVELPLPGMLDWRAPNAGDLVGVKWEDVPYLDTSGVLGVGGERRRFRRNLMRKGM